MLSGLLYLLALSQTTTEKFRFSIHMYRRITVKLQKDKHYQVL